MTWTTLMRRLCPPSACSHPTWPALRQRHVDSGHSTMGSLRDLSHSDSDSSLPYMSELRHSKIPSGKVTQKALEELPTSSQTPNGGNRHLELSNLGTLQQRLSESPQLEKKLMEKSASLGEISMVGTVQSHSDSSRSHSPSSTEAETPSPGTESKHNHKSTRIPQLAGKKNLTEDDSGSTGEENDPSSSKKKLTLNIFKKPKK
ncbi:unnamed protein product [Staurois parvus]|uniref:Uncharacterized protein n=1 Tax=Staurois parvus TaxID=386267 RepID=A0ABN9AJC9_9NEOB|nr:unnamed protein product [Staurois parvus]